LIFLEMTMRKKLMIVLGAALIAGCGTTGRAGAVRRLGGRPQRASSGVDGTQVKPVTPDDQIGTALAAVRQGVLAKRSVFFDYDSYVIKDEYKSLVEAHAKLPRRQPEGEDADPGQRRRARQPRVQPGPRPEARRGAAQDAALLGAREEQIEAVSLGEEKPRCSEGSEACWSQNRRDDMLYTGEF
jgi:peptidoglycan-associated lipoprotein